MAFEIASFDRCEDVFGVLLYVVKWVMHKDSYFANLLIIFNIIGKIVEEYKTYEVLFT